MSIHDLTDKQIALRILATGVLLAMGASGLVLSGCAAFDNPGITVAAGSSICTAKSLAECERLSKIAATLHSPEMEKAIAEARK